MLNDPQPTTADRAVAEEICMSLFGPSWRAEADDRMIATIIARHTAARTDPLRTALEIFASGDMWEFIEGEISGQDGWACDCFIWKGAGESDNPIEIAQRALEKRQKE